MLREKALENESCQWHLVLEMRTESAYFLP